MFAKYIQLLNSKDRRSRIFLILTGILTVLFLVVGTFEFVPAWILRDAADDIHLWHIAELGALSAIFLGGIVIQLVRRPEEKPLLAQFLVVGAVILALGFVPFEMKAAAFLLIAVLVAATYPRPRMLLNFSREGRVSIALLVLTILFALFLIPIAWREVNLQIVGMVENDVHAFQLHWIGSALLITLLILAGLAASTKRPGWNQLGVIVGATYCYLGVIAMIVPGYAGSWGEAGGLFTIIGGVLYILFTLAEAESLRIRATERASRSQARPVARPAPVVARDAQVIGKS